jgi:undecaprenyl-diphosphatase
MTGPLVLAVGLADRVDDVIGAATGPGLYALAALLTFAETGTMFFLIPGEIGLFIAGAAAAAGDLNLVAMVALAIVAALLGDATGFFIGRRFGHRLKGSWIGRRIGEHQWHRAEQLIKRRRGLIVLVGRWLGFLRAIMPASAGMSGMSYRSFLLWDVLGCVSWASLCVVGGYLLGDNWGSLADWTGKAGWLLLLIVVAALVVHRVRARHRERRNTTSEDDKARIPAGWAD